ncbi:hypothetical protein Lfu02_61080 [Longispora fulva]|nr:hypothetical protein Lfu02_61080 [Longispora fulva]
MARGRPYPLQVRRRAVEMYAEIRMEHRSDTSAHATVARNLGVKSAESVRAWVRQDEAEGRSLNQNPRTAVDWAHELRKENVELRRVNEALKTVVAELVADLRRSRVHTAVDQTARMLTTALPTQRPNAHCGGATSIPP